MLLRTSSRTHWHPRHCGNDSRVWNFCVPTCLLWAPPKPLHRRQCTCMLEVDHPELPFATCSELYTGGVSGVQLKLSPSRGQALASSPSIGRGRRPMTRGGRGALRRSKSCLLTPSAHNQTRFQAGPFWCFVLSNYSCGPSLSPCPSPQPRFFRNSPVIPP